MLFLLSFVPSLALSDNLNCPCKVVKVTDGDTVNVHDQKKTLHKIRLQGIDAPERKQAFGRKSTQNLAKYVAVNISKWNMRNLVVMGGSLAS
jgi:endonuclease YncB( thermonuclease family)